MGEKAKFVDQPSPWFIEIGPLAWFIVSLWAKMVYFNFSLRTVWSLPEESVGEWLRASPRACSATLASLLLLCSPLSLVPRGGRFLILLTLNFLLSSLVVADLVYAHYYGDVISVLSLSNLPMLPWIQSTIVHLLKPIHAVFYVDTLVGIVVFPFYLRSCRSIPRVAPGFFSILFASGLLLVTPTVYQVWRDQNESFTYTNLQRETCMTLGLLPYHIADVVMHAPWRTQSITESDKQRVRHFVEEKRKPPPLPSKLFGVASGKNVVMINAESIQAFVIGLTVEGQSVTPRLSQFANESLNFVNFYDQTYLGTTADGEFTSLQSLHPLPVGVVASQYSTNHYDGLPALVSKHRYMTLSAVGAEPDFWNMDQMYPRLGFQRSYFDESYKIQELIGPWIADEEFFHQTIPILRQQPEPFMAFLLTASTHAPWELPEKYHTLPLGHLEGTTLGNYLRAVHYFDQAFGRFIDELRDVGLLDKSIIVMYGDHQAYLGKDPEVAHLLGFPEQSEYHHLMTRKKIPLLIRLPKGEAAGVRQDTGGHLDIAPTVLSLLGITDHGRVMFGRDLTQVGNAFVVFRDGSFVDGKYFFVNRFGPSSNSTCYQINTTQAVDCALLEEKRQRAQEQLAMSDLIIRGDLIPRLH